MDIVKYYKNRRFKEIEILLDNENKRILFPEKNIREILNVKNQDLPISSDTSTNETAYIDIHEVFEYIRYAKADIETRWDFEEWISEIILDCAKLI